MNEETENQKKEKIIYTLKQKTKENKDVAYGYESVGFEEPEEINDLTDLDEKAFHFTSVEKIASISATGLKPTIGANSSGGLGKEATEKTFFSYGINGFMQIFNRTLSAAGQVNLSALQEKPDHSKFLTSQQRDEKEDRKLTILEAFEFTRRYMEDNRYFVFDLKQPKYVKNGKEINIENLNPEELESYIEDLNSKIKNDEIEEEITISVKDSDIIKIKNLIENTKNKLNDSDTGKKIDKMGKINQVEKMLDEKGNTQKPRATVKGLDVLIKNLKSEIDKSEKGFSEEEKKLMNTDKKLLLQTLKNLRAELTLKIREVTKSKIDEVRGIAQETEGANYEVIDYNEERMVWTDIRKEPHNCHTLLKKDENGNYKRSKSVRRQITFIRWKKSSYILRYYDVYA